MSRRNRGEVISIKNLQEYIVKTLGDSVENHSEVSNKPLIIEMKEPYNRKYRIYAFNCNNPPGGRPINEYKIVLNVGQEQGQRGIDYSDGCFLIVIGMLNNMMYLFMDSTRHKDFGFNKNMQVKSETILRALASPISLQKRRTWNGEETIIAARSEYLIAALNKRISLLHDEMAGE